MSGPGNTKPLSVKQLTLDILSDIYLEAGDILQKEKVMIDTCDDFEDLRYSLLYNGVIRKYRRLRVYEIVVGLSLNLKTCFQCYMEFASQEELANHIKVHRKYIQDKIHSDVLDSPPSQKNQNEEKANNSHR